MLRVNRYRRNIQRPKRKKVKRDRKSKPLERSVHINGKRWGWEFTYDRMYCGKPKSACNECGDGCPSTENPRVKIVSPDNRYFEIKAEEFETPGEWECGQKYVDRNIRPGAVKEYISNNLLEVTDENIPQYK